MVVLGYWIGKLDKAGKVPIKQGASREVFWDPKSSRRFKILPYCRTISQPCDGMFVKLEYRKWRRRARHPKASEEQCFWNKSWKGFRPRYCCEEMDVPFKSRDRFSERMGGYASDSGASSGEEWRGGNEKVVVNARNEISTPSWTKIT